MELPNIFSPRYIAHNEHFNSAQRNRRKGAHLDLSIQAKEENLLNTAIEGNLHQYSVKNFDILPLDLKEKVKLEIIDQNDDLEL